MQAQSEKTLTRGVHAAGLLLGSMCPEFMSEGSAVVDCAAHASVPITNVKPQNIARCSVIVLSLGSTFYQVEIGMTLFGSEQSQPVAHN